MLGQCDLRGDSTEFVEFGLEAVRDAMASTFDDLVPRRQDARSRLESGRDHFGSAWFARAAYRKLHRSISTASASRDLAGGVAAGILEARGARRLTEYRYR